MDSDWERIRILSIKLRSLSHLIETQSPDVVLPSDVDEIYWGLSLMLNEISADMRAISGSIEEAEIVKIKPSRESKKLKNSES